MLDLRRRASSETASITNSSESRRCFIANGYAAYGGLVSGAPGVAGAAIEVQWFQDLIHREDT
jgi:hypothetical protein